MLEDGTIFEENKLVVVDVVNIHSLILPDCNLFVSISSLNQFHID
jgi:hypothetical protein